MKKVFIILSCFIFVYASCKKEEDHDHHHDTDDSTIPVVTLTSPIENATYHNGDTVFITGSVTDNELHAGTIIIRDDTTLTDYFSQIHNVHQQSSVAINFQYIVSGITTNRAVTLSVTYEDHKPNVGTATRKLIFVP